MPKPKKSKSPQIHPRFRVTCGEDIALGPGKSALLALVKETGSIGEAAKRMDMSYMRAWTLVQTMNQYFKEPLVLTARGGSERGGAELTETGDKVLKLYEEIEQAGLRAVSDQWRQLQRLLRD